MGKKSLKTLAKELEFTEGNRYLVYICESLINGNITQVDILINDMRKADIKLFLEQVNRGDFDHLLRYRKEEMIDHILKHL